MKGVIIIVVNWNTGDYLARCLRSLARLPERSVISEVVVVDNASTDGSLATAQAAMAPDDNKLPVRFIAQAYNVGFARANNTVLNELIDEGRPENVLLLNPDTEVRPQAIANMLAALAHDRVGMVGPQLLNSDGTFQPSVRSFPTLPVFVFFFLKLHYLWPQAPWWRRYLCADFDPARPQNVDQVMGAALLARHEMIREIGILDEGFWIWFEEVDWCKRAVAAGWNIVYTPAAQVLHRGGVSFNQVRGVRKTWLWSVSSIRYAQKHLGMVPMMVLVLLLPVTLAVSLPAVLVRLYRKQ